MCSVRADSRALRANDQRARGYVRQVHPAGENKMRSFFVFLLVFFFFFFFAMCSTTSCVVASDMMRESLAWSPPRVALRWRKATAILVQITAMK